MATERVLLKNEHREEQRELLLRLLAQEGIAPAERGLASAGNGDQSPLSYAQKRLWFLDRLQPGSDSYNVPIAFELQGKLELAILERSLHEVVERHGVLRTRFAVYLGEPVQKIEAKVDVPLQFVDLRGVVAEGQRRCRAEHLVAEEGRKPFDLAQAPLLRCMLLRLAEEEHILALTLHHIVCDEWSLGVLWRELVLLYEGHARGEHKAFKEMPVQYADYAAWQREWLQGDELGRQLEYWRRQLLGMSRVLDLPTDKPRPAAQNHRGRTEKRNLGMPLWEAIKALSWRENTTGFMTLLAAYEVLLLRYTGQDDFGVGTPVANRSHVRCEGVVGFCVNTMVMRANLHGKPRFMETLGRVRRTALEGYAHQDLPFERLVEELAPERDLSRTPLFQVMFTMLTGGIADVDIPGLKLRLLETEIATSKFDLTMLVSNHPSPDVVLNYDSDLFERASIKRMLGHYERLLEGIVADPERGIWELPLLTEGEERQLKTWNQTFAEYPREQGIADLFEAQAGREPSRMAVSLGRDQITYAELDRRSNQLAHYLRALGVGPESLVGICIERSLDMVIALLGILKAGGAYVPLDPEYPQERLRFMVYDSGLSVVLTELQQLGRLPATEAQLVCLDRDSNEIARCSEQHLKSGPLSGRLAYVIYTSGSTGSPKAVAIEHRSVVALLHWAGAMFSSDELAGVLASTSLSFDLSVFEIFVPLSWGGKVILVRNALALAEMDESHGVTLLNTVPSAMVELVRMAAVPDSVRTVNLAGEVLPASLATQIYQMRHVEKLWNLYGPSEDTTYSTFALVPRGQDGAVPIGRPIANTRAYVLDSELRLAPAGVAGELYLSGEGLARGYLKQAELSAKCFVPDPFSNEPGTRMYRTGDRAKFHDDGNLEFLGRQDQQVKVRGYRIELAEVEAALLAHPGVERAIVVVRGESSGKTLAAYLVARNKGADLSPQAMHAWLTGTLPDYMIPTAFVVVDELPLTPSGKVDRKALPDPEARLPGYRAPRTPREEALCEIFGHMLKLDRVGIDVDFFAAGGHSLLATGLVSRIRGILGVEIALRDVFEAPSVAALAPRLQTADPNRKLLAARRHAGPVPLSFAQQRLWFINQLEGSSEEYNMPEALCLRGDLDLNALKRTVQTIVDRHEILRTHFAQVEGQPVQIVRAELQIELPLVDLTGVPPEERDLLVKAALKQEWEAPFDLACGPLLRLKLLKLDEQNHVLLRTLHHIVSDGWSHGVFTREFMTLYDGYRLGDVDPLPPLPLQYVDFALWQRESWNDQALKEELRYWKEKLAGIPAQLELPRDRPRPAEQTFAANACAVTFPTESVGVLKSVAQVHHATLYMTMLAGLALLLERYSGQHDIVVGSPIANRQDERLEAMIGFFVNTLVMRVVVDGSSTFAELLAVVRATALEAYRHQDLPFEKLVEELSPERNLSTMPIFQVMFAVQNAPGGPQRLEGLVVEPLGTEDLQVRFDLEIHAFERQEQIELYWIYNRDLFDSWRVEQMARQYRCLLEAAAVSPEVPVRELQLLSPGEKHQLLEDWNFTWTANPQSCVHELFEEQAERTPESTALICEGRQLSYRELNERANRTAHLLLQRGVGPETLVGVGLERSIETLVAVLGILKAGGAYVPIASDLPPSRREFLIASVGLEHMVTKNADRALFSGMLKHVVTVDGDSEELGPQSSENPAVTAFPANPAYVNFTSGSTGHPKGVLVPHASVVRLVCAPNFMRLDHNSRVLHMAPLSFDAATLEIWGALLNGGSLVLAPPGPISTQEVGEICIRNEVNTVWLSAGLFREVVDQSLDALSSLQQLLAGGDVLSPAHVQRVLQVYPQCRVINGYGPTENTTFTCCYPVEPGGQFYLGVPIGFPVNNTRVYVLDADFNVVPPGVTGELYAAGAGLARGYLQRPDLTAERFLPNPYEPGERMYRTGDMVRWRADGAIEFVGRNDTQIKLRGYRVELGEIEAVLKDHQSVGDALVMVREHDGDKQLLGYVVEQPQEAAQSHGSQIAQWRQLYESTYDQDTNSAGDFNIVGWNSSYTGGPIPAEEMRIWVEETVASIRKLRPRRVLEIGCGTGLLLTRIAAECTSYFGLDFSKAVLDQLGNYLATRRDLQHVVLRQGIAHDLAFLADDSFDLVILNSVVQYFPNVDYLVGVLAEAVRVTRVKGHIFVGDVRSLPLLEAYHTSVQLHKAAPGTLLADLRQRILQAVYSEEELLVDPDLFSDLARQWKKIGRAQVSVKAGAYDNELSRFRYDVTLQLGKKERVAVPGRWLTWDPVGEWRQKLEENLREEPQQSIGVHHVRDRRVRHATETVSLLQTAEGAWSVERLRAAIENPDGEDPNSVAQLAQRLGVEVCWQGFNAGGSYDLVFQPLWEPAETTEIAVETISRTHYQRYTNAPAQLADAARLSRMLQEHLRKHLPEYMVPSTIVVLPAWPLRENGKIDRAALPAPQIHTGSSREPRTPQEEILAEMFADVLGLDRVTVEDNFFDLGGHSLMATRLVSRIRAALGIELPLRALFEKPTVALLASSLDRAAECRPPLIPQPRPDRLPASYAQQRLWFIDKLEGTSTEYNMCEALRLHGRLDVAALRRTISTIIERHESLRTRFAEFDGAAVQIIAPTLSVEVLIEDLSEHPAGVQQEQVQAALALESNVAFDLSTGPLLRMRLLKLSDQEHVLLRTFHHIVSDGWSHGVFTREFMAVYDAYHQGRENPLPALPVQYADFALWQRSWLNEEVLNQHLEYWTHQLAGAPEELALPHDRPRPAVQTFRAEVCGAELPGSLLAELKRLNQTNQTTLYMTLLAGFAVLLQRYSGQTDIVVGSPIANRQDKQLEQLIGLFVNSLVMRVRLQADETFVQLLQAVKATALEAFAHQNLPFERLVEAVSPQRSLNMTPIFQVLFALQNAPMGVQRLKELQIEPLAGDTHSVRAEVEVHAFEDQGHIAFLWLYKSDLFDRWRMEQMARHYVRVLETAIASPQAKLKDFDLFSAVERLQILVGWNQTRATYDRDKTISELVEAWARRSPGSTALRFQGQSVTYAELDRRSNQLARHLRKLGVSPEVRVGACIERGPMMIVAFLAILKAGGTYVPLEPEFPTDRLAYMVENTAARLVVTQSKLRRRLPPSAPVVDLEAEAYVISAESPHVPQRWADSATAAYIIYTSGSTGRPKGVVIEHRNVLNMVRAQQHAFVLGETERVIQFFSFGFDVSIFVTLMALGAGATLVLGSQDQLLPGSALCELMAEEGVTIGVLPPVVLDHLREQQLPLLRQIIVGGEPWSEELLNVWGKGRRFFNSYGPTETAVQAAVGECHANEGKPSIGRPIANARIYLLDEEWNPVPAGVAGELYIGGDGVGRGYLDCALTAEKFLPDTFGSEPGGRLYRTGDWGRWLPDGRIDLLGRKDDQVKIRGHRVELGEIEAVLNQHPGVQQAALLVRQEDRREKRLIAYVVSKSADTESVSELRNYLKDHVPEYMIPSQFVMLEELPLNSSGKIDRKALPVVAFSVPSEGRAPRSAEEEVLVQIFSEVLGMEHVGIDDSFFDLGGHSLMATRLASRVRSVLGVEIPLRAIFETPTVALLSSQLHQAAKTRTRLTAQLRPDRLPLSYAQQRLWFLDQMQGQSAEYNMPEALCLEGDLNREALERAMEAIVERHEILRTRFAQGPDGEPAQVIEPRMQIALPLEDLRGGAAVQEQLVASALRNEWEQPFDLSRGPLLRMKLFKLGERKHVLLRTLHHIVTDGWSQGLFNRELMTLYEAFHLGHGDPLDPLPIQYVDFALWQRKHLEAALPEHIAYWKQQLAGIPDELALPKDRPRPSQQTFIADIHRVSLSVELAASLKQLSKDGQATLYMTLLCVLAVLLHRYSGQDDIVVGSPIANRQEEQLEKLIGFFVNSLVLRVRIQTEASLSQLLTHVRNVALDAYRHQDLPFERLVEELSPQRSMNITPIYQVLFVWQNAPMAAPAFKDLTVSSLPGEGLQTHFDMELQAMEQGGSIELHWIYNRDLFDRWRIEQMSRHFLRLLTAAAAGSEIAVRNLPMLEEQDEQQLLFEWNATERSYAGQHTIAVLFEQQAARTPESEAVAGVRQSLTYRELNERANQLAHHLRDLGIGPDVRAGVCVGRGPQMLVGILGILKAGGAYVPLDPKYPAERLSYMVEDSELKVLLTERGWLSENASFPGPVICLDEWSKLGGHSKNNPPPCSLPENLAYVTYTSGSTGKPKGVAVTNGNLVQFVHWSHEAFSAEELACVLFSTSICFDLSVFEMFVPLTCGGVAFVVENALELAGMPEAHQVTLVNTVPSVLRELVRMKAIPSSVRTVNSGGEVLSGAVVREIYETSKVERVVNLYGPSEDTVYSTCTSLPRTTDSVTPPPIGKPIANSQAYVLDERMQPVAVGITGELLLGGTGQARGYLNRPELTAERFVPDPFSTKPGSRLYRTGDLVKWGVDGNLEFVGRADHQVKIRGFRIELSEIEAVLQQSPAVEQAVVVPREDESGEKRLTAYVVARKPHSPSAADLREYLQPRLPEYMKPTHFVLLERFPLTENGKVDRKSLPKPQAQVINGYAAPSSPLEHSLAHVWQQVLGVPRVGLDDNFFDLGGHSLLVARVRFILREMLKREIAIVDFFGYPTVRLLARRLEETEEKPIDLSDSRKRALRQRADSLRRRQDARKREGERDTPQ